MDKLKKIFEDPMQLAVGATGIGLLCFYYFYARKNLFEQEPKPKREQSILNLSLRQLTKQKHPNIVKIVITESISSRFQFRGKLITRLKQFLQENNQQALVNCAPLKLFDAGTETFSSTLTREDVQDQIQFLAYFQNALKCELIIQKTIVDLQQIRNSNTTSFLICDTNSIDLKIKTDQDLWNRFLQAQSITQQDLQQNYQIVFQIKTVQQFASPKIKGRKRSYQKIIQQNINDNVKIQQSWKGFSNFHQLQYSYDFSMQQNVDLALQKIIKQLKPYLPESVKFKKQKKLNLRVL